MCEPFCQKTFYFVKIKIKKASCIWRRHPMFSKKTKELPDKLFVETIVFKFFNLLAQPFRYSTLAGTACCRLPYRNRKRQTARLALQPSCHGASLSRAAQS